MSKPPTAEEVLGLYAKAQGKDGTNDDYLAFHRALRVWRESQGPVTREWFVERFGGEDAKCKQGVISFWQVKDSVGLAVSDSTGDCIELHNPTRERIEALVEMLGGTQ